MAIDQYIKQKIAPFLGMANTPQPDHIKDEQSSDMLNLRFTKLGYLVNRNGVRAFEIQSEIDPDYYNKMAGATSIGEFVFSAPVTDYVKFSPDGGSTEFQVQPLQNSIPMTDFDRMMIFGVRVSAPAQADGDAPTQGKLLYLGIPISNIPDNVNDWDLTADNFGDVIWFAAPETANGLPGNSLMAPARRIERPALNDEWVATNGRVDDENWIEHYQAMAQFAGCVVISDRINGDLILHDEYDEAEPGAPKEHKLRFQENCLANFDVDIVKMDLQLGAAEKNGAGVQNGLALYKLYPTRIKSIGVNDGWQEGMSDLAGYRFNGENHPQDTDFNRVRKNYAPYFNKVLKGSGVFAKGYSGVFHDTNDGKKLNGAWKCLLVDRLTKFRYSNHEESKEIDSLLHPVTFVNPDAEREFDDEGNEVNNNAADVFVWNELQVKYYPCSGKDLNAVLLRSKDRDYVKKKPGPKVHKLNKKKLLEQDVPLGIYGYRFVWDMGNGEMSAPSAVMQVPDLLYSVVDDTQISNYHRYVTYGEDDSNSGAESGALGVASNAGATDVQIRGAGGTDVEMRYTNVYKKIKAALYDDIVFSSSVDLGLEQTLITVYHKSRELTLKGVAVEGFTWTCDIDSSNPLTDSDDVAIGDQFINKVVTTSLTVPLTKRLNAYITYNSLFADESTNTAYGAMRKTLPNGTMVNYELVFEGNNYPLSRGYFDAKLRAYCSDPLHSGNFVWVDDTSGYDGEPSAGNINLHGVEDMEVFALEKRVYVNYVRSLVSDTNNSVSIDTASILRFTTDQAERLLNTRVSVPQEVIDRLLMQGIAEIVIAKPGDIGVCVTEDSFMDYYPIDENGMSPLRDRAWRYDADGRINDRQYLNPVATRNVLDYHGLHVMPIIDKLDAVYVWGDEVGINEAGYGSLYTKYVAHPIAPETKHYEDNTFSNLTIAVQLPGERLLLPEQLTAYFPSSLLFNAPRVRLFIEHGDIPPRAKKVKIYRTLATHDNGWQPTDFGFVDEVAIERDNAGVPSDIEFFDDVKDADVDFTQNPNEFDGLIRPLKSRFLLPLYEKMWYMNFVQTYQPQAPRGFIANEGTVHPTILRLNNAIAQGYNVAAHKTVVDNTPENYTLGYRADLVGKYAEYMLVFKDLDGVYSDVKRITVSLTADTGKLAAVALMFAGYPYIGGIERCDVYRRTYAVGATSFPKFIRIGEIKNDDEGVFVDSGEKQEGDTWEFYDDSNNTTPISEPYVQDMPSGIIPSQVQDPSWIKLENQFQLRSDDGDQITGAVPHASGDLVVFKETSIHRLGFAGRSSVERVDQLSGNFGMIAPLSLISYNYMVYFLSHEGLMRYDNNIFSKADGDFAYELKQRINDYVKEVRNPAVRDVSSAYNAVYNELYINIPAFGQGKARNINTEGLKGHIYVLNMDTQMATKFGYEEGDDDVFEPGDGDTTRYTWDRCAGRIYFTNSLYQLWSADMLPKNRDVRSLIYLEAPTNTHADEFQLGIQPNGDPQTTESIARYDVQTWLRSKAFTADDRSIVKRVRKVIAFFAKATDPTITGEFLNNEYMRQARDQFTYPTLGELEFIPPRKPGHDRGERFTVELASRGETEIQNLQFYWRAVNTFIR